MPAHYSSNIGHQLAKLQKKLPESAKKPLKSWVANGGRDLHMLLHKKSLTVKQLEKKIEQARKQKKGNQIEIQRLEVFMKELNETEAMVVQSLLWMDTVLRGDYMDMFNMKESSRVRLDALRNATLTEQQEYNMLVEAEVGTLLSLARYIYTYVFCSSHSAKSLLNVVSPQYAMQSYS